MKLLRGVEYMSNIDDIIDPEDNSEILMEATGKKIEEETTILPLMVKNEYGNPLKIKVRYLPASAATAFEFDDGMPLRDEKNPKFKYKKSLAESLKKINGLCLKNIKVIDDLSFPDHVFLKGEIRLSHIAPGEWARLRGLCFPGADVDTPDSETEDNAPVRARGKGVRKDAAPVSD